MAYGPHVIGTASGLTTMAATHNVAAAIGAFLAGQATSVVKTYWDRRKERKKEEKANGH